MPDPSIFRDMEVAAERLAAAAVGAGFYFLTKLF